MTPLSVKNVTKEFGSFRAVNDVSFEIGEGEVFGLLGPNGAGKTTIISMITTLHQPTSGTIEVFGKDVMNDSKAAKMHIGPVPQELVNHGYFTLEEILDFHSKYYGKTDNQKQITYLLKKLNLYSHRHKLVSELSGGMKRRMIIAKALVHAPKVILLDEPTAGVDIELRAQLWDFVKELKDSGCSILLTTHYLEEAEKMCDRVGILHHGKLKKIDETSSLLRTLAHREISIRLRSPLESVIKSQYIKSSDKNDLLFVVPKTYELSHLLDEVDLSMSHIQDISIREGNLEDVFQQLTRES